ncbi:hypothetical protein [Ketobacter sp.]|uniref:hypothetical protein n=1 Tax=Ketobacter sp. TaxID=2083498 RepID=UPI0025C5E790|nr:hypothetical protein [Ketobacter sp.]MEE2731866.1 hypothetical protein [Pseudomonadota bacterium]
MQKLFNFGLEAKGLFIGIDSHGGNVLLNCAKSQIPSVDGVSAADIKPFCNKILL